MKTQLVLFARVLMLLAAAILSTSCEQDDDIHPPVSTAMRIGIDFYALDDSSPNGSKFTPYASPHDWSTVELTVVTVPEGMTFVNIWIQVWSPDSGAVAYFNTIDVSRNGTHLSRGEFGCDDTTGWWGEWFYDGNPLSAADDSVHEYDNHLLSAGVGEAMDDSALRILVPAIRYSSAAFLYSKIDVDPGDVISFSARVGIPPE